MDKVSNHGNKDQKYICSESFILLTTTSPVFRYLHDYDIADCLLFIILNQTFISYKTIFHFIQFLTFASVQIQYILSIIEI